MRKYYPNLVPIILIFFVLAKLNFAQESVMIDYEVKGNTVEIYYILQADTCCEYDISLNVKRTLDKKFIYTPQTLSGDFGMGKFAGGKRTIIWSLTQDEIKTMHYEDFYFEIIVEKTEISSKWPWYYYATGLAVIGGVVAIVWPKTIVDEVTPFPSPPGPPITK